MDLLLRRSRFRLPSNSVTRFGDALAGTLRQRTVAVSGENVRYENEQQHLQSPAEPSRSVSCSDATEEILRPYQLSGTRLPSKRHVRSPGHVGQARFGGVVGPPTPRMIPRTSRPPAAPGAPAA